jgi:hypothetical protein
LKIMNYSNRRIVKKYHPPSSSQINRMKPKKMIRSSVNQLGRLSFLGPLFVSNCADDATTVTCGKTIVIIGTGISVAVPWSVPVMIPSSAVGRLSVLNGVVPAVGVEVMACSWALWVAVAGPGYPNTVVGLGVPTNNVGMLVAVGVGEVIEGVITLVTVLVGVGVITTPGMARIGGSYMNENWE